MKIVLNLFLLHMLSPNKQQDYHLIAQANNGDLNQKQGKNNDNNSCSNKSYEDLKHTYSPRPRNLQTLVTNHNNQSNLPMDTFAPSAYECQQIHPANYNSTFLTALMNYEYVDLSALPIATIIDDKKSHEGLRTHIFKVEVLVLPETLQNIEGYEYPSRIKYKPSHDYCINHANNLITLDMSKCINLISTPPWFASALPNLETINLSGCKKLQTIKYGFAKGCPSLVNVDLSRCITLEKIHDWFASECPQLTNINLSACKKLKEITSFFAAESTALAQIDLSDLTNLHTIKEGFLRETNIQSIDLSKSIQLSFIGHNFARSCPQLTTINISGASRLCIVRSFFAYRCKQLTSCNLSGVTYIEPECFEDCSALKIINLSAQPIYGIGRLMSWKNKNLTSIDLSNCVFLTRIKDQFANYCPQLQNINLSGCINLTNIGVCFARGCTALRNINLSGCSELQTIENQFANNCQTLQNIDLSGCTKIRNIGDWFAMGCKALTHIDISDCIDIDNIGNIFAAACSTLHTLQINSDLPEEIAELFKHRLMESESNAKLVIVNIKNNKTTTSLTNLADQAN